MQQVMDTLVAFNQSVFRNVIYIDANVSVFNDLSDDTEDWHEANLLTEQNKIFILNAQYHAIDYIFSLKAWQATRFSEGHFPVWYSALELNTSFCETLYHWLHGFIDQMILAKPEEPIYAKRTVFATICDADLVDLRAKCQNFPYLIQKDITQYADSQKLGARLCSQGFPGLITQSARTTGTNVVMFNKKNLHHATYSDDYLYAFMPNKQLNLSVRSLTNQVLCFETRLSSLG